MTDPKLKEINRRFEASPEYRELKAVLSGTTGHAAPETFEIEVSRDFVRLLEFVEKKFSRSGEDSRRSIEEILSRIIDHHAHDQLHWLTVEPTVYRYYEDVWNRICDEAEAQEYKITEPPEPEKDPDIPF